MKDAILKLAERQLIGGGYGKLNFAVIAEALNTTRANLHYHFKNKESLAIAVTEAFGERQIAGFEALQDTHRSDFFGFIAAVDASIWHTIDQHGNDVLNTCTMLAIDPELPASLRDLSQEFFTDVGNSITAVIQAAMQNGEIRTDIDAEREAAHAHALIMGIMASAPHLKDEEQARQQFGGLLVKWAEGLKPNG